MGLVGALPEGEEPQSPPVTEDRQKHGPLRTHPGGPGSEQETQRLCPLCVQVAATEGLPGLDFRDTQVTQNKPSENCLIGGHTNICFIRNCKC